MALDHDPVSVRHNLLTILFFLFRVFRQWIAFRIYWYTNVLSAIFIYFQIKFLRVNMIGKSGDTLEQLAPLELCSATLNQFLDLVMPALLHS